MPAEQFALYALTGAVVFLALLVAFLLGRRARHAGAGQLALPPGAEALAPAFIKLDTQLSELQRKVQLLATAASAEQARQGQEDQVWQAVRNVERALVAFDQVPALQQDLQKQIAEAVKNLTVLRDVQTERQKSEDQAFASLKRLDAVMLGSSTAGAAGERVVQEALGQLPAEWYVTNHAVNGKRVEFAIKLLDGLLLPVDSKVLAQTELAAYDQSGDEARAGLERAVQRDALARAKEVNQYVDARTPGYAVAALPDAAYRLCGPVLARAYEEHHTLLVPYSLLVPLILTVYAQHQHARADLDVARLARLAADAEAHLRKAQQTLNGHLSGALVQLGNGRDSLARELNAAIQGLAQLHLPMNGDEAL